MTDLFDAPPARITHLIPNPQSLLPAFLQLPGQPQLRHRPVALPISAKSRDPHMLGVAPSTKEARGINAWIFYPRVRAYSAELGMHASQLLGHVMAHEMGHLLLPYGAHALAGLMRPEWDRSQVKSAAAGLLTFTPDQAALIRNRLRASASPTGH